MPLADITRPEMIKFLTENYEKTARLRWKWSSLHADELKKAASLEREEKGFHDVDVIKECIKLGMATITRDHVSSGYNRRKTARRDGTFVPTTANLRKEHGIPEVGLGDPKDDPRLARPDDNLSFDPIMRPVPPRQEIIIYKDLPTFGRKVYLKVRERIQPEKKYYFAETSGMQYGWRLCDSYFGKHAPAYGRVWRLTRDTRSRTGPQPDPKHYKSLHLTGMSKCPAT